MPSTLSWLDQYSQQHEFQGSVARSDVSVTGTYADDPAQVENIIRDMRKLWGQPSGTGAPLAASGSCGYIMLRELLLLSSRGEGR